MGAELRVFRQKIRSAQTTKKITRAMELISASRIQKAQRRCANFAPYANAVRKAVSTAAAYSKVDHPLITERANPTKSAIVVFTSDRGLAGAFNAQVLREDGELAERLAEEGKSSEHFLVGRKAVSFYKFRQKSFAESWIGNTENPDFAMARQVSAAILEAFRRKDKPVHEVHLIYNKFVSMMIQTPEAIRLLPIQVVEGEGGPESGPEIMPLYNFEPDADRVLDALLEDYVESRVFNALLQSAAAKHAATQKAMKSASDNADKLILDYTRLANNARQAEITQQIAEIVGGADALADVK